MTLKEQLFYETLIKTFNISKKLVRKLYTYYSIDKYGHTVASTISIHR